MNDSVLCSGLSTSGCVLRSVRIIGVVSFFLLYIIFTQYKVYIMKWLKATRLLNYLNNKDVCFEWLQSHWWCTLYRIYLVDNIIELFILIGFNLVVGAQSTVYRSNKRWIMSKITTCYAFQTKLFRSGRIDLIRQS